MKTIVLIFGLNALMLIACSNQQSFVVGSWVIDNLNYSDTTASTETLMATVLVRHYTGKNILIFATDNSVTLTTADHKELDKGDFKLIDNGRYLTIEFHSDEMESRYKISDRSEKSFKLSATDNGETINILLRKVNN